MLDSASANVGQPRWSPDDRWIYYERRPALMRVRPEGETGLDRGACPLLDVSPDGKLLAFYSGPQYWNVGAHTALE